MRAAQTPHGPRAQPTICPSASMRAVRSHRESSSNVSPANPLRRPNSSYQFLLDRETEISGSRFARGQPPIGIVRVECEVGRTDRIAVISGRGRHVDLLKCRFETSRAPWPPN